MADSAAAASAFIQTCPENNPRLVIAV